MYKLLFDQAFKKINYCELKYKSLDLESVKELYQMSKVILDINHPHQTGLTMRTFEALGAGKKLITTNKSIMQYSFYNQNNIHVINRQDPVISKDFFETPFLPIADEIKYEMSISGWLSELFLEGYNSKLMK